MAVVKLGVAEIDIGNVDHSLTVWSTKNTRLGQLVFSRGSVEWWPKGNRVNAHTSELNLIEIVWKQAKYHWRNFVIWTKETIDDEVRNLLGAYGTKFQIHFA